MATAMVPTMAAMSDEELNDCAFSALINEVIRLERVMAEAAWEAAGPDGVRAAVQDALRQQTRLLLVLAARNEEITVPAERPVAPIVASVLPLAISGGSEQWIGN